MSAKLTRCPKCGDDVGVSFNQWELWPYLAEFGGDVSAPDGPERFVSPKTGRCVTCGARIYIDDIQLGESR